MLPILFDNDDVIVIDKPPGLATVAAGGEAPDACVHRQLEVQVGARLWAVHRLDRETSGVLAFARHAAEHRRLNILFESRLVRKVYVALTAGIPSPADGRIETRLHDARKGKTRPAGPGEAGVEAVTDYHVAETWTTEALAAALVELRPRTGRRHQLRVHLRSTGAPILGDRVYGRAACGGPWALVPCPRLALHARSLTWPSAIPDEPPLTVSSPLPADLSALVEWFRRVGGRGGAVT